ncbi:uncharacterized protein LOC144455432 [Phascolarctos cinereus]
MHRRGRPGRQGGRPRRPSQGRSCLAPSAPGPLGRPSHTPPRAHVVGRSEISCPPQRPGSGDPQPCRCRRGRGARASWTAAGAPRPPRAHNLLSVPFATWLPLTVPSFVPHFSQVTVRECRDGSALIRLEARPSRRTEGFAFSRLPPAAPVIVGGPFFPSIWSEAGGDCSSQSAARPRGSRHAARPGLARPRAPPLPSGPAPGLPALGFLEHVGAAGLGGRRPVPNPRALWASVGSSCGLAWRGLVGPAGPPPLPRPARWPRLRAPGSGLRTGMITLNLFPGPPRRPSLSSRPSPRDASGRAGPAVPAVPPSGQRSQRGASASPRCPGQEPAGVPGKPPAKKTLVRALGALGAKRVTPSTAPTEAGSVVPGVFVLF